MRSESSREVVPTSLSDPFEISTLMLTGMGVQRVDFLRSKDGFRQLTGHEGGKILVSESLKLFERLMDRGFTPAQQDDWQKIENEVRAIFEKFTTLV